MSEKFEHNIKQALENYSVPMEKGAWDDFSKKLENSSPKPKVSKLTKGIGAAVVVISLGAIVYFYQKDAGYKPVYTLEAAPATMKLDEPKEEVLSLKAFSEQVAQVEDKPVGKYAEELEEQQKLKKAETLALSKEIITDENEVKEMEVPSTIDKKDIESDVIIKNDPAILAERGKLKTKLSAKFKSSNKRCLGDVLMFAVSDASCQDCSYTWDFGDGNTLKGKSVKYAYMQAGEHNVSLRVKNAYGDVSSSQKITINPLPKQEVDVNYDEVNDIPQYEFEYLGEKVNQISWKFADGSTQNKANFNKTFFKKGSQDIQINVTNTYGCSHSMIQTIEVEKVMDLQAPLVFSPNNDGRNDTWMPILLRDNDRFSSFTLQIFDAQKRQVFYSDNPNNSWNGIIMTSNRKVLSGENYVWQASVKDKKTGQVHTFQGAIRIAN